MHNILILDPLRTFHSSKKLAHIIVILMIMTRLLTLHHNKMDIRVLWIIYNIQWFEIFIPTVCIVFIYVNMSRYNQIIQTIIIWPQKAIKHTVVLYETLRDCWWVWKILLIQFINTRNRMLFFSINIMNTLLISIISSK